MTEEIFDTEEAIPETPEVVPRSSSVIEFHRPHLRFYKDPESDPNQGKLILEPLQKGYGQTMGLSLKTVLVSQMPGQCIKRVRVEGLDHRYSRIKGIKEPLRVILMNFSRIIIRAADPLEIGRYELSLRWPAEGPVPDPISTSKGEVLYPLTARYITGTPLVACDGGQAPLAVVNPEGIICHLEDPGAKLDMTLIVESGVGYVKIGRAHV